MPLTHELPSEFVEEAAEDDIVTALMGDNPLVDLAGFRLGGIVHDVQVVAETVVVAAAALELGRGDLGLLRSAGEVAGTDLADQFGRLVLVLAQSQEALGLDHQGVGIAEDRKVGGIGSVRAVADRILVAAGSFVLVSTVDAAEFNRIVAAFDLLALLVVLLAPEPGVGQALVVLVIGGDELRDGTGTGGRPARVAVGLAVLVGKPEAGPAQTVGIRILERESEDDLGAGGDVRLEVVQIVGREGVFAGSDHGFHLVEGLLVVGKVGVIVEPGVVVEVHLGEQHVDAVIVHHAETVVVTAVPLDRAELGDDEIPSLLRLGLGGHPTVRMDVRGVEADVAEIVEQGIVHQGAEEAQLIESHGIALDGIHFHHAVALRNGRIGAGVEVAHVADTVAERVLVEQDVIFAPADSQAGRNAPHIGGFLDVTHAVEFGIDPVDVIVCGGEHGLDVIVRKLIVLGSNLAVDGLVQVGAGRKDGHAGDQDSIDNLFHKAVSPNYLTLRLPNLRFTPTVKVRTGG